MMADAAVCGFEMVRGDGTKVEGLVKEKQEAKRDYEKAISEGYTAGLGQQETGDVFSITVGNVSPGETVTINLRYVQPLMDDEKKDQIKFIFPRTYAQRYGSAPSINAAVSRTAHQPFQMDFMIQQAGAIRSISCPSGHPISLELGAPEGITSQEGYFASVSLTDSTGFLTQDVILVITAAGLDAPRCFIEPHQSPNEETTAMALTFVPQFNLPDVQSGMEYVFLVDRSGSMQGTGIQLVREALVVLLRGLPTSGTTFNIFSFGSTATKLWPSSRQYSQSTLDEATGHIDSMQANYGGTEIASALQLVYDSLPKPLQRPVAVFLLTDGSAWDVSTCVENTLAARLAVSRPDNPKSYIRVFTVGIGSGASTDTCDSIARAGEGMAVYVKEGEPITGKCARLVRAARTPLVKVEVEWGMRSEEGVRSGKADIDDDFEMVEGPSTMSSTDPPKPTPGPISLFGSDNQLPTGPPPKPNPTPPPLPLIQQSPPTEIPSILPGTRTQIYAIVRTSKSGEPLNKVIKIKGVVTTTGDPVELIVPVTRALSSSSLPASLPNASSFIHVLAAKALIRDREQGKHSFPASVSALFTPGPNEQGDHTQKSDLKAAYLEKDVIRLGTRYNLASRYTSFVAVDHSSKVQWASPPAPEPQAVVHGSRRAQPRMLMKRASHAVQITSRSAGPPGQLSSLPPAAATPPPPPPGAS
ncbi:von Willebrand factor type A domain-containing protein, partial [Rhodocollybia butyracea]